MGRLLAFLLGGLALALYAPPLFLPQDQFIKYDTWLKEKLSQGDSAEPATSKDAPEARKPESDADRGGWHAKIFRFGPGVFAGLALLLLAIRGRDSNYPVT